MSLQPVLKSVLSEPIIRSRPMRTRVTLTESPLGTEALVEVDCWGFTRFLISYCMQKALNEHGVQRWELEKMKRSCPGSKINVLRLRFWGDLHEPLTLPLIWRHVIPRELQLRSNMYNAGEIDVQKLGVTQKIEQAS